MMAKQEKPFRLDMDFDEALKRYIGTDPREMAEPTKPVRQKERHKRLRPRQSSERKIDKTQSDP